MVLLEGGKPERDQVFVKGLVTPTASLFPLSFPSKHPPTGQDNHFKLWEEEGNLSVISRRYSFSFPNNSTISYKYNVVLVKLVM